MEKNDIPFTLVNFPICFWVSPKFSSLTHVLHYEHIFQTRGVSSMSQWKRFSDLDITKQLAKDNTAFNFIAYHIWAKANFFFDTHKNKLQQMLEYSIKIIQ